MNSKHLMSEVELDATVERLKARFLYQFHEANGGYSVDPGWLPIFTRLCEGVDQALSKKSKSFFYWVQWKEKFGSLRAYFEGGPTYVDFFGIDGHHHLEVPTATNAGIDDVEAKQIQNLVHAAETESARTCMFCGAPGRRRTDQPWIVTACDGCANTRRCSSDEDDGSGS